MVGDNKNICQDVMQRKYDGWTNSEKVSLVKCGKYYKLKLEDVRSFTLYQVYNEFNKKLNCDRNVQVISKQAYQQVLDKFKNRTCYGEFQTKKNNHVQFSFYLKSNEYDIENNNWLWIVKPDKLFIDGIKIDEYKILCGTNINISVDFGYSCSSSEGCSLSKGGNCKCTK